VVTAKAAIGQSGGLARGLRRAATVLALALLITLVWAAQGAVARSQTTPVKRTVAAVMDRYEARLAAAINVTRKHHGLRSLQLVPGLMLSSDKHSLQMACRGYFSHSSVNGASFITRVKRFYGSGASNYFSAGENLLWAKPRATPRQVVKRWLASPEHRLVLLSPQWRVFGVGVVSSTHAAGIFRGRAVLLVTADFAVKR
jgi:uncharacterized protein YkwD